MSDYEDDEKYEEPQKDDYCAARTLSYLRGTNVFV